MQQQQQQAESYEHGIMRLYIDRISKPEGLRRLHAGTQSLQDIIMRALSGGYVSFDTLTADIDAFCHSVMEANPQGTAEHIRASDLRRFNNDVRVRSAERFRRPAAAAAGDGRNGAETISPLRPATAAEAPAVSAAAAAAPPAAPAPSAAPPTLAGPGALPAPPVDAAPKGDASAPSSALKLPTDALDASNPSPAKRPTIQSAHQPEGYAISTGDQYANSLLWFLCGSGNPKDLPQPFSTLATRRAMLALAESSGAAAAGVPGGPAAGGVPGR